MMVLCWVDAGRGVGLGHVSRVLALAEALRPHGLACRFVLADDAPALAWLRAADVPRPVVLRDGVPALPQVLELADGASAVIVDIRRPLTRVEVRALRRHATVLAVDNPGAGATEADLVLAPGATARGERWLTGPEHVPLRRALGMVGVLCRAHPSPVVLVSMGASDPGGLVVPALEGLALARETVGRITARVVASPLSPSWKLLPSLLRRLDAPPAVPVAPGALVGHLAEADLVITAMGVTVYEAMAAGAPAIVACRTRADVAHAETLAARGAIVSLGRGHLETGVAAAVTTLLREPARRAAMAEAGPRLVDGHGAERVIRALIGRLHHRTAARGDLRVG